jgi:hypothetical protein
MPDVLIRNVDAETLALYKAHAIARGVSLQVALKDFLEANVPSTLDDRLARINAARAMTRAGGPNAGELVRKQRDKL